MMGTYRRGDRISANKARSMIMMMAKFGNHQHPKLSSDAEVKKFLKNNSIDFEALVSKVRDGGLVTLIENITGSSFQILSNSDGHIRSAVIDSKTGDEIAAFDGDGFLLLSASSSRFETSERRIRDALLRNSTEDLISAVESGVSSVEGFIAERVSAWNRANQHDLLIDNAMNKVSLSFKIETWIPKITGGLSLNKGSTNYQDFAILKKFRDDYGAHLKDKAHAISQDIFKRNIDKFRTGIAGTLIDLHKIFGMKIPCSVIREYFSADVVKNQSEK